MPSEFTLSEVSLGESAAAIAGPPPSTSLGPSVLIDKQEVKARWGERYTSNALNKKFVGMPRGVYYGFVPSTVGLVLSLAPDISLSFTNLTGAPQIAEQISGGTSSATATVRVISPDFILIDTVSGTFQVGETITGLTTGFTAEITSSLQEGISFARVTSNTPEVTGRSEHTVSIITTETVTLDFAGFSDGVYYIYCTGSYSVGATTVGAIAARTTPQPNQITEVLICTATKIGSTLTTNSISPTSRQEPFASVGQRIVFMPGGSVEALLASVLSTQEVIASRQATDGTVAPTFDLAFPQTTGLPKRLADDLSRQSMANRLGKSLVPVRGNDYLVSGAISAPLNVSGSFAARVRDYQPFKDVTNEDPPSGIPIPLVLDPYASDNIELTVSGVSGSFGVGEVLVGATSGAQAVIRAASATTIELNEIVGVFQIGEVVDSVGPPVGSATIDSIDLLEGVITAENGGPGGDPIRNIVSVVDTYTGRKPVDASGNPIYGRLLFGPNAGPSDPGEYLVATGVGQQLNYVQNSLTITNNGINFNSAFLAGDIVEGADGRWYEIATVTSSVLTLTAGKPYLGSNASAGLGVGPGPRRRRRYLLQFVSKSGGVETQQTITPGTTVPSGSSLRPFFPAFLKGDQSHYAALLDMQAPGNGYGLATTAVPGVGYNATGTGGGSGTGSPVIGAIRTIQQAGVDVGDGNFHTINFTAGSISQASPGVLNITSAGPTGPVGPGGGASVGPTGPAGPGYSTIFAYQTQEVPINAFGVTTGSIGFTFAAGIRFYMVNSGLKNADSEVDTGVITGVTAVSGNNTITVNYRLDGGGGTLNQVLVIGAAAAA
ncbi:MAG: hypothetical protein AB7V39_08420 [Nitrospiraceae bacterium]